MKHLIIIGCGGFAREVCEIALNSAGYMLEYDVRGFLQGDVLMPQNELDLLTLPVLGTIMEYKPGREDVFVCAVGSPQGRQKLCDIAEAHGAVFTNVIHKTAGIASTASLGRGIVMCPYAGAGVNTRVGNHVVLNSFSGMGHDAVLGDYSVVSAYCDITGHVKAGKRTFWGSGSRAVPNVSIGDDAYIGAGSVVLNRVKPGAKVFGVPAVEI